MKFGLYVLATTILTGMIMYNAAQSRKQFYNASIFLTTSKFNLVVLGNLGFLMLLLLGKFIKAVFLGPLTRTELEDLEQNARFTMVETCFALWAVFREDLNLKVLVLFATLLFVKIFHWLAIMRVDNVGQSQDLPLSTHVRLQALFGLLSFVDVCCVVTISSYILSQRTASMLILLDFEYLILCVTVLGVVGKYALWVIDSRTPGGWHNRSSWMFYLDVTTDVIRLFFYLVFFLVVTVYYGLPLHLIRELYLTMHNLKDRITKFIHYRKLTRNMNERFPDATAEELHAGDRTCIVCREDMVVGKKLPCNHIFHFHCLRSWLEQHHNCPMCRAIIPIHAVPPLRPRFAAPADLTPPPVQPAPTAIASQNAQATSSSQNAPAQPQPQQTALLAALRALHEHRPFEPVRLPAQPAHPMQSLETRSMSASTFDTSQPLNPPPLDPRVAPGRPPFPPHAFPSFMFPFGMPFVSPSTNSWSDGLQHQAKLLQDHIMFLQHQLTQANLLHQQLQLHIHALSPQSNEEKKS